MLVGTRSHDHPQLVLALIPIGERAELKAQELAAWLRRNRMQIALAYKGNVKKRMQQANAIGATAAIIFGDDELDEDIVKVRKLDTGEETEVITHELVEDLPYILDPELAAKVARYLAIEE